MKRTMKNLLMLVVASLLVLSCNFIRINESQMIFRDGSSLEILKDTSFLTGFTEFECNLPATVIYSKGPAFLEVSAPDRLKDGIVVSLKDSVLVVGFTRNVKLKERADIEIRISSETLENLCLNGAVHFVASDSLVAHSFRLSSNGASECEIATLVCDEARLEFNGAVDALFTDLNVGRLRAETNGAASVELKGRCDSARITINGTGEVDAKELECPDINSQVNGIGYVKKPSR